MKIILFILLFQHMALCGADNSISIEKPIDFKDPILNLRTKSSIDNVLLYRDRARTKIGQWNLNNLDISSINALIDSISAQGKKASASCGGMSFYLEKILQENFFKAHMLAFYSFRNNTVFLHAANYVAIDGDGIMIDGHSGMVWQNKQGKLASPIAFGCQTICYDNDYDHWEYYPSTHAAQYAPHKDTFFYTLDYMNMTPRVYKPVRDPGLVSAIAILKPNKDHLNTYFELLYIFDNGRLSQEYLTQLYNLWHKIGNIQDDTVIRYINKNDCGCNKTQFEYINQNIFQVNAREQKFAQYSHELQGPEELLKVNQ